MGTWNLTAPDTTQHAAMPPEVDPNLADPSFLTTVHGWIQDLLIWVGFGTIVGLVARFFLPARDAGGALGTLLMGIGGVVIGCGILSYFSPGIHISPISPLGFFAATGGAFIILFFYRLLSTGSLDGNVPRRASTRTTPARPTSSYASSVYHDAHPDVPRPQSTRRTTRRSTPRTTTYRDYDD